MTCEYTWPNHMMGSDRLAVEAIITQHGFHDDVAYGQTKLFVRTPRSLFTLEQERAALIPILVLFLQKVATPRGRGGQDGRLTTGRAAVRQAWSCGDGSNVSMWKPQHHSNATQTSSSGKEVFSFFCLVRRGELQ